MPINIAITRKVRPGREAEFQEALREIFKTSFDHEGVLGATMIVPQLGSDCREYGVLRTFADEKQRDEFYSSPDFKAWDAKYSHLVEGTAWTHRPLHGLEAWFRSPKTPPPRWKMASLTLLGVYPVSLLIRLFLSPHMKNLPVALSMLFVSALMVVCLTWFVMPFLIRLLKRWI